MTSKSKEYIYYVDEDGKPSGETKEKLSAHSADTMLHAAFSCYVFNEDGKFLVTQRASSKKVWPGMWTNSCCGHPAPDESMEDAIKRRSEYELGLKVEEIQCVMPKYTYKTPPYKGIVEHEFCPVYTAIATSEVVLNKDEVKDYKWVDWDWYLEQLKTDPNDYSKIVGEDSPKWSWWAKDQLKKLCEVSQF